MNSLNISKILANLLNFAAPIIEDRSNTKNLSGFAGDCQPDALSAGIFATVQRCATLPESEWIQARFEKRPRGAQLITEAESLEYDPALHPSPCGGRH